MATRGLGLRIVLFNFCVMTFVSIQYWARQSAVQAMVNKFAIQPAKVKFPTRFWDGNAFSHIMFRAGALHRVRSGCLFVDHDFVSLFFTFSKHCCMVVVIRTMCY